MENSPGSRPEEKDGAHPSGARDGGSHSSSGPEQLHYFLPSLSSSSDASAKRRATSAGADGGSLSSSDAEHDLGARKKAQVTKQSYAVVGGSSASRAPPGLEALVDPARLAEMPRGAHWTDSFVSMLSGLWESSAAASSSSAAPAPQRDAAGPGAGGASSSYAPADPLQAFAGVDPDELLGRVPRNPEGDLTSLGSMGHQEDSCVPCPFWFKGACVYGVACKHCHFAHEGQKPRRLRPSKHGRERQRQRLEKEREQGEQPDGQGFAGTWHSPSPFAAQLLVAVERSGLRVAAAPRAARQQMSL